MAIDFPRFNTIDYGNVLANVEQIKSARLRNRVLGAEATNYENQLANREKARQIRQQIKDMPGQIEALDAQGLTDQADQLRQSYITTRLHAIQMIGAMRDSIDETNYKQVRSDLIKSGALDGADMPTEYSKDWFRKKEKSELDDLRTITRKWGVDDKVMAQDLVEKAGQVVWTGAPYETTESRNARKPMGDSGKPWEMQAADTNAIRNASAELYGGFYDPITGRYSGLNAKQQQQIASVNEEASRIYRESKGQIGHAEAVARAARLRGIKIDDLQKAGDPLGVR